MKKGGRKKRKTLRTVLVVLAVFAAVLLIALVVTEPERREGRNLPIADVDFSMLSDGTYHGEYAGGRLKLRANEVEITISSAKITGIESITSANTPTAGLTEALFERVIEEQSVQVDTVSGATITSKSYLKSIEDALVTAGATVRD